jgi:hypothetical protein
MFTAYIIIIGLVIVILSVAVARCRPFFRVLALLLVCTIVGSLSYSLGKGREKLQYLDNQGYWFPRYAEYLNKLVEQNDLKQLTNDISLFESKYNRNNNDPMALQKVMYEILKLGPYSASGTNEQNTGAK